MVSLDRWLEQPWALLVLAIVFTLITARGLATGSATLTYRACKRTEDPALYWTAITVNALVAVAAFSLLIHGAVS